MGGVEVPQAPRGVGSVEGVSPSTLGKGSGEGAVPLPAPPQKIIHILLLKYHILTLSDMSIS